MKIGEALVSDGLITEEQLNQALEVQKQQPDKKLGVVLLELGFITEKQLSAVIKTHTGDS